MSELILRCSGLDNPKYEYALQIRNHGPVETDYYTLCYMSLEVALEVNETGGARFLFDPLYETNLEKDDLKRVLKDHEHLQRLKIERADLLVEENVMEQLHKKQESRKKRIKEIEEEIRS